MPPTVPENYKGPTAIVTDSGSSVSFGKTALFALTEIDGRTIHNAIRDTRIASEGMGAAMNMRFTERPLATHNMKVKLVGTHQTGAPIHEMMARMAGTFFRTEGITTFKPVEGHAYTVTGTLVKEQSCVWIMDNSSQEAVTEKLCN